MTAQEARQIAENKVRSDFRESLDNALLEIKRQSSLGKYEVLYFGKLTEGVEIELKKLGYVIERKRGGFNETDLYIKW